MDYSKKRKLLIDWTKKQLTGGSLPDDKLVGESPLNRFFTGFLFPIVEVEDIFDEEEEFNDSDDVDVKPTAKNKRYIPPSSAGFSFFISGENPNLRVYCNAVNYNLSNSGRDESNQKFEENIWERNQLTSGDGIEVEFSVGSPTEILVFNGLAKVDALWRPYQNGFIVTLSISNNQHIEEDQNDPKSFNLSRNTQTLFEVEFKCIVDSGYVGEYPSKDKSLLTDEEKELELRYKDEKIYAVGHGAAVDWDKNIKEEMELWIDFFPAVEVPQVTADTAGNDNKVLEFNFLKEIFEKQDVLTELESFVDEYESWIDTQKNKVDTEEEEDKTTAKNIVKKIQCAKERMRKGIELIRTDEIAKRAFAIANEAMLMQMSASDKAKGKIKSDNEYRWRPFQLAFVLMVLESAINEDSDFRDTLDLIWFPTGGGKTEAYLGLMAFLFVYRRQKYSSSYGGTVAIMRYTLRLLTSQQFLRASKVISALELIRRRQEEFLGSEEITIGLWVGGASSPNSYKQALDLVENKQFSKLILNACPWCNQEFNQSNFIARADSFHFTCTNNACDFGKESNNILPYNVVDEALYKQPPSLLIATVDKFARLAWEERAGSFFGINGNRPPELIIQDELHLISSALGSIVGVYEIAIDTALIAKGMRAKYIASTATIKNADKQVKTLFARAC